MNKKLMIGLIAAIVLFSGVCFAASSNRRYYYVNVVDEWGELVTSPAITQIDIQNESGVAVAVYSTKTGTTEVGSTGVITTGLSDGETEFWYADTALDITVTDGTYTREIESFAVTDHRFMFPTFLTAMAGSAYGQTDDIDFTYASWIIDGDTLNRLDMIPDNDGGILGIGDGTAQADVYIYSSSTAYAFFDEGNKILELVDIDIDLDDASVATFGSDNDFEIYSDTGDVLEFDPGTAGAAIYFGTSDTDAVDIKWFTDVSGNYVLFDEENDEVYFTDVDVQFDNDADIIMGTTDATGFTIDSDTAKTLDILAGANSDDFIVNFGLDQSGVDVKIFGATTGEYWSYDASEDSVLANTGNVLYTTTDAEADQFKVDATGAVNGDAINYETTDGGIMLNADGSEYGDIELNSADDTIVTSAGDFTLSVTGSTILPNDVLLRAVVDLTATDINDLEGTPFELIASPAGTDLTIEFVSAIIALDYGSVAWTEDSAPDDLVIRYTDGSGAMVSMLIDATGLATATADTLVFVAPIADIPAGTTAAVPVTEAGSTDQSLVLDNTGTDWTAAGDSVMRVIVYYRLHTTAELGL